MKPASAGGTALGTGTLSIHATDFARQLERELNEANDALHEQRVERDELFDEAYKIRVERDYLRAAAAELVEGLDQLTSWGIYQPDWATDKERDLYKGDFMEALAILAKHSKKETQP